MVLPKLLNVLYFREYSIICHHNFMQFFAAEHAKHELNTNKHSFYAGTLKMTLMIKGVTHD